MKLIHAKDYEQMSRLAAEIIADMIRKRPDAVLGLATGNTPIGLYRELCRLYREDQLSFRVFAPLIWMNMWVLRRMTPTATMLICDEICLIM